MKKIILITAIICFINVTGYANDNKQERNMNLFVDSYHYGLSGKDCSEIYSNFRTSKWTFNSNDPGDLDKLYEGCKVGEKDWIKGQKELPQVLDKIKNKQ
jgi:hypothetical protein